MGGWVSHDQYGPKSADFSVLNAFFPSLFDTDTKDKPYWTMPSNSRNVSNGSSGR